jgi:C-terminal processing protease CtpA/Prc
MMKFFRKNTSSSKSETGSNDRPVSSELAADNVENPGAASQSDASREGEALFGVGIVFQIAKDGCLYIQKMSEDGAASQCGILEEGDCLVGIDSDSVLGWTAERITNAIKGKIGS